MKILSLFRYIPHQRADIFIKIRLQRLPSSIRSITVLERTDLCFEILRQRIGHVRIKYYQNPRVRSGNTCLITLPVISGQEFPEKDTILNKHWHTGAVWYTGVFDRFNIGQLSPSEGSRSLL